MVLNRAAIYDTKVALDEPAPQLVYLDFLQVRRQVGNAHLGQGR